MGPLKNITIRIHEQLDPTTTEQLHIGLTHICTKRKSDTKQAAQEPMPNANHAVRHGRGHRSNAIPRIWQRATEGPGGDGVISLLKITPVVVVCCR